MTDSQLAAGTYEVLRNRLRDAATDLRSRLARLNEARAEVFGNIETKLVATERVTTEHNCIPRDLVSIGDQFLFGYNVQFGLKTDIGLADVFSAYQFEDHKFHERPLELISDPRFLNDFGELYRFYKGTSFSRFYRSGPMLHMVFQVGKPSAISRRSSGESPPIIWNTLTIAASTRSSRLRSMNSVGPKQRAINIVTVNIRIFRSKISSSLKPSAVT